MKKILSILLLITLQTFADVPNATFIKIKKELAITLPKVTVDKIQDTPIANVYEITSQHKIFYVDISGKYALIGNLVDLTTKDNLTQIAAESINVVNFSDLPLKLAIQKIMGNGRRKIAIFTDPECPFCKRLEQETVPNLKDVTIYYYLYPLAIHERAASDAKQILCSEIPVKTLTDWMKDNKVLPTKDKCNNVTNLKKMKDLGNSIGLQNTPSIILQNGRIIPGLVPADYLNQMIANASPIESQGPLKIKKTIQIESK